MNSDDPVGGAVVDIVEQEKAGAETLKDGGHVH